MPSEVVLEGTKGRWVGVAWLERSFLQEVDSFKVIGGFSGLHTPKVLLNQILFSLISWPWRVQWFVCH